MFRSYTLLQDRKFLNKHISDVVSKKNKITNLQLQIHSNNNLITDVNDETGGKRSQQ